METKGLEKGNFDANVNRIYIIMVDAKQTMLLIITISTLKIEGSWNFCNLTS